MAGHIPEPTARLRFRPYRSDDAPDVADMFSDAQARRFYPTMEKAGQNEQWIQWNLDNYAAHGFGLWVIEDKEVGSFLGDCGLTYQPVEGQLLLEVGYHVTERHRGKGYATEAGRACISYAFDVLEAPIVCSIVDPENTASVAVASRLHPFDRDFIDKRSQGMRLFWTPRPS